MRIETDRKCRICGAHAPIMEDDQAFRCMTCQVRGGRDDFPYITGLPACPPAPSARNRMGEAEFHIFVAERWNRSADRHGGYHFAELNPESQRRVFETVLDCINELPGV